jgi:dihydrofolate synthase/folylpolyglutamate synthase
VGLGGRLDATNVVERPRLTVITPVSIDHQQYLGETLAEIAGEKAGILKRGVRAVIAAQEPEAQDIITDVARKIGARLTVAGEDFEAFEQRARLVFQNADRLLDLPLPSLAGHHQIGNAATAVAAALELGISDDAIERGLVEARWPARMQKINNGPLSRLLTPGSELWLDGGHNPAGAKAIAQTLAELDERAPKPVALVLGMMGQKDAGGFLAHFRGLVRAVVTVPIPGAPEAAFSPEELAAAVAASGIDAEASADVEAAIRRAQEVCEGPARILICGSLYLAGQVLALQEGVQAQAN